MSGSTPKPGATAERKKPGVLALVLGGAAALATGFVFFTQVYTEVLWYDQLGYLQVWAVRNGARIGLFLAGFLLMFSAVFLSMAVAYRNRPVYAPGSAIQQNLERYQQAVEAARRLVMVGVPAGFGFFAGTAASAQWDTLMLWWNSEPFGTQDPLFGNDISFYLTALPWWDFLVGFLMAVAFVAGLAGLVTHYIFGSLRVDEKGVFISKAARLHAGVAGAFFLVLLAVSFFLDRFSTLVNPTGRFTGAMYTDVNATIPTKAILAVAALIVAALFVLGAALGRWKLPIVGGAMLALVSVVAGAVFPWALQRFVVLPSELSMEREYIQRNIDMTRLAYGIDKIDKSQYNATTETAAGALRKDAETTASIRLLDPALVSASFAQLEQYRQYYAFPQTLNVDRYTIDGKTQDTVIAVRELNVDGISEGRGSWYNSHVVYTHGYGVVAAYGNKRADDGKPVFMQYGIPSQGILGEYEPRIYFGEQSPDYSIVGAPEGAAPLELDYPQDNSGKGEANTTFKGDGGPSVGSLLNKLAYAVKFGSEQILLSEAVNEKSQILYDRNPRERVKKVAPYLTVDGNAYPAVVEGRVQWIVDGYTTSSNFPYSTPQALDSATADTQTSRGAVAALPSQRVNYIRNSVKATVDAYDGSVKLYAWDDQDPLLKAWQKVFPSTVKPLSDISGELMAHTRYPEDLFKVQRSLVATYHVDNADELYSRQDAWQLPADPTVEAQAAGVPQPAYYLTLKMPGQENPAFSLTSSFIPQQSGNNTRNVLTGFLAADADAGSEKGTKAEGYGKLRLLELPRDTVVPGPGQAQNNFNADPTVSQALNLLRQGSSQVQNGNLLTLPVAGGLLYVQPVYVRSSGETSYPLLQRVLVAFGDKIGFAPTLNEALDQLFSGDSGAQAGDAATGGTATDAGAPAAEAAGAQERLAKALKDASDAVKAGQEALAKGDFAAYGQQQTKLQSAINEAVKAEAELGK